MNHFGYYLLGVDVIVEQKRFSSGTISHNNTFVLTKMQIPVFTPIDSNLAEVKGSQSVL